MTGGGLSAVRAAFGEKCWCIGAHRELNPIPNVQNAEDSMQVNFDGANRQSKFLGDDFVGCSIADHLRNLRLPCCKTLVGLGWRFGVSVTRRGRFAVRSYLLQESPQSVLQVLLDRDRSLPVDCR